MTIASPKALAFVVARSYAGWVYVAPIALALRMLEWIAVDLGSGRVEQPRAVPRRQPATQLGSISVHRERLNGELLVSIGLAGDAM